ncbi:MAG: N-acetyltransferase [Nitrospirae bacterium]|nr:MAG: N-acetyltransferase [Nitrospirota bacterium]
MDKKQGFTIRRAVISDVREIQSLINRFARKELMLPKSLNEIYENLRDYYVCRASSGAMLGVCALHILWEDLAEIRSLAVTERAQKHGIGKKLVSRCLKEARALGLKKVFVLTYSREFFQRMGFKEIEKSTLPQKIWSDCLKCHKFPDCDEFALIKEL